MVRTMDLGRCNVPGSIMLIGVSVMTVVSDDKASSEEETLGGDMGDDEDPLDQ